MKKRPDKKDFLFSSSKYAYCYRDYEKALESFCDQQQKENHRLKIMVNQNADVIEQCQIEIQDYKMKCHKYKMKIEELKNKIEGN